MNRRITVALILLAAACAAVLGSASSRSSAAPLTPPANGTCAAGTVAGYPAVSCLNKTWHCSSLQKHTQVHVTIKDSPTKLDAVHLDSGCTGVVRITITTDSGDGVKVHGGAHDLSVWGGTTTSCGDNRCAAIICTAKHGIVHQDGIQAMGGERVTFRWFKVWCPTGNNGALYVHGGAGGQSTPTDIVCEWCDLYEANAAIHIGPGAVRSGARWSTLHDSKTNASPANCRRIDKLAVDPIDVANTCLTPK